MQNTATSLVLVELLENTVRPYAWGSPTAIPQLLGQPPSGEPQAELWMGAHPAAPSRIRRGGDEVTLIECISADPIRALGATVAGRFGPRLPFLLKVIAAQTSLSLQAHPNQDQAEQGYADENAQGIPMTAPVRNYKDPNHKPEVMVALTPFEALCGFRPVPATIELLELLVMWSRQAEPGTAAYGAANGLEPLVAALHARPDADGLREVVTAILTMPEPRAARFVAVVAAACRLAVSRADRFDAELRTAVELADEYPSDTGVVTSLLLNRVNLAPGEAVYLAAGNLHAYLRGVGIELMANSDNVLRGGLTHKYVDVPELLRVLDVTPGPVPAVTARRVSPVEDAFDTPAAEFRLSRLTLRPGLGSGVPDGSGVPIASSGPQILLTVDGEVTVTDSAGGTLSLSRGKAAWVPAAAGTVFLSGAAVVFRATTNVD